VSHSRFRHSPALRALHWLTAWLVFATLAIALLMTRAPLGLEATVATYQAHKSIGLLVAALTLLRVWMTLRQPAQPAGNEPLWRRRIARAARGALYSYLLAMPLIGWLQVSAAPVPFPTVLFGAIEVPHLSALAALSYEARVGWYQILSTMHRWLGWAGAILIGLHIVGAIVPESDGRRPLTRMRAGD
jgi:cytochrome b561